MQRLNVSTFISGRELAIFEGLDYCLILTFPSVHKCIVWHHHWQPEHCAEIRDCKSVIVF